MTRQRNLCSPADEIVRDLIHLIPPAKLTREITVDGDPYIVKGWRQKSGAIGLDIRCLRRETEAPKP